MAARPAKSRNYCHISAKSNRWARRSCTACCGNRKTQQAQEEAEDVRQATIAPIDETAARTVLEYRQLLQSLESEWSSDDAWLDRIVCGRLIRKVHGRKHKYFGLLLSSSAAPISDVVPDKGVKFTSIEGQFLWPMWTRRHSALKIDSLHLIPLNCRGQAAHQPAESWELGKLLGAPTTQAQDSSTILFTLDFGFAKVELEVKGEQQAARWEEAVRAVLLSCLSSAAELEGPLLVEALQNFDQMEPKLRVTQALKAQKRVLAEIAQQAEAETDLLDLEDEEEDYDDAPLKLRGGAGEMMQELAAKERPSTALLIEACERIAATPRVLVTAAVRSNPVRQDILSFWCETHHKPFCEAIEALWEARIQRMLPGDLLRLAECIHQYRVWLERVRISDPSMSTAIAECSDSYGRRSFAKLTTLAENVAELCEVEPKQLENGSSYMGTNAATDLFYFLGPPCEAALSGPPELQAQAAAVVDGALKRYLRLLKWRLLDSRDDERKQAEEEEEQRAKMAHRELVAALLSDAEEIAEDLSTLLCEVGAMGDDVAPIFQRIEGRFRLTAEGFCEALVTLCLRSSRAASIYGLPPSAERLVGVDLHAFLSNHMTASVHEFQRMVVESWRSRFGLRLITRFIALEIFVLVNVTKAEKKKKPVTAERVVAALVEHEKAFSSIGQRWLHDDASRLFLKARMQPLKDVIGMLTTGPAELEDFVRASCKRHEGALTTQAVTSLLELRPELSPEVRSRAVQAASAKNLPVKRSSILPVEEAKIVGSTCNAFQWAADASWVTEIFGLNRHKEGASADAAKRPRPRRVKRKTEEEIKAEHGAKVESSHGALLFYLYGKKLPLKPLRGFTVVVLDEDLGSMVTNRTFDTCASKAESERLERFLKELPPGCVILAGVFEEGARNLTAAARQAFAEFGARRIENITVGDHYAFVGTKAGIGGTLVDSEAAEACTGTGLARAVLPLKADPRIKIVSAGFEDGDLLEFYAEGQKLHLEQEATRGFTVVVLEEEHKKDPADEGVSVATSQSFDTGSYEREAENMAEFLSALPSDTRILVGIKEDGAAYLNDRLVAAMGTFGAAKLQQLTIGASYAFIGRKGHPDDAQEVVVSGGEGKAIIDETGEKKKRVSKKRKLMHVDDFFAGVDFSAQSQEGAAAAEQPQEESEEESEESSESDSDSDGDDDDEHLRGFLFKQDESAHRKAAYNAAAGFVKLRWVTAGKCGAQVIHHLQSGGWVQYYFKLKKDMRGQRTLFWYQREEDTVSLGSLPLREITLATAGEDGIVESLPAYLELHSRLANGSESTILFRSPFIYECNFWVEKLMLLRERELNSLLDAPPADGVVLVLAPTLSLRDPERSGGRLEARHSSVPTLLQRGSAASSFGFASAARSSATSAAS